MTKIYMSLYSYMHALPDALSRHDPHEQKSAITAFCVSAIAECCRKISEGTLSTMNAASPKVRVSAWSSRSRIEVAAAGPIRADQIQDEGQRAPMCAP